MWFIKMGVNMVLNNLFLVFYHKSSSDGGIGIWIAIVVFAMITIVAFKSSGEERERELEKTDGLIRLNGVHVITQLAKVSTKRVSVYVMSKYYVTFEILENKSRIEFEVSGESYGLLSEGDKGNLTYQGDKLIEFERVNVVKVMFRR